ncbi:hypothetical protein CSIM01_07789 [Colletotrichum simmondsii]|uniref:Uncharacterized protein n=1 Tax=Colletotrichum simmondsii TaxID=703756 RepID=A0A135SV18_9PEZI|nr:hypothetical protein CSIM01_07789 [Colletotrichum simmondsii]
MSLTILSVTKKQTGAKGHDKLLVSVSPPPVRDEDDSTMHIIQFASNYAIPAHSVPSAISVGGLSSPGSRNKPSPHFVPYGPRIPGDAYPSYRYKACASAYRDGACLEDCVIAPNSDAPSPQQCKTDVQAIGIDQPALSRPSKFWVSSERAHCCPLLSTSLQLAPRQSLVLQFLELAIVKTETTLGSFPPSVSVSSHRPRSISATQRTPRLLAQP